MAFNNVPVNGWPQIKDLEKLDAVAQQIADMPTFTSNDRAFLEDLPAYPTEDGAKVLTATTSSGGTSLSYEEIPDELPADPQADGVRVLTATTSSGETTKSWEVLQAGENQDFSTSPVEIGKWTDGSKLYRRVDTYVPQSGSTKWFTDFSYKFATVQFGFLKANESGDKYYPLPALAGSGYGLEIQARIESNKLGLDCVQWGNYGTWSGAPVTVVTIFTKNET